MRPQRRGWGEERLSECIWQLLLLMVLQQVAGILRFSGSKV